MPISVICPSCKKAGSVPESAVGQRIKCPKCKNRFEVGDPSPGPSIFDDLEHRHYFEWAHDVTYGMSVLVLADEAKGRAARGVMMARLAEPLPPPGPKFPFMRQGLEESKRSMVSLAVPLQAWLEGRVPAPDLAAIDGALGRFAPSARGSMEYFLGRLLANHGLPDDAIRYLGRAARGRNTDPWFRALAIRELRRKKVPLGDQDISPPI